MWNIHIINALSATAYNIMIPVYHSSLSKPTMWSIWLILKHKILTYYIKSNLSLHEKILNQALGVRWTSKVTFFLSMQSSNFKLMPRPAANQYKHWDFTKLKCSLSLQILT